MAAAGPADRASASPATRRATRAARSASSGSSRRALLFLGEADFIRQQFSKANFGQSQFVSYLGATYFIRGFMLGVAYERFQEDSAVKGTGRDAYDVEVNVFPWAHFELNLLGRYQTRATVAARRHAARLAGDAPAALLPVRWS